MLIIATAKTTPKIPMSTSYIYINLLVSKFNKISICLGKLLAEGI